MGLKERPVKSSEYLFGRHAESTTRYATVFALYGKREVSQAKPETTHILGKVTYRPSGIPSWSSDRVLFVSETDFERFLNDDEPLHAMPRLAEAAVRNRVTGTE